MPAPEVRVVISQSMYFPWVGLLEQIRLADTFVRYDDVQLTRGFYNRVQVKTANGPKWITVPLLDHPRGVCIDEAKVDNRQDWRGQHRELLRQSYFRAPYRDEMLALVDQVFDGPAETLADISHASLMALADYFGLTEGKRFVDSRLLGIKEKSSQRLLAMTLALGGTVYVTGHGARNYLDHDLFEQSGVRVEYMKYRCLEYPQLNGPFTPFVTGLDLVAHCGREGRRVIQSESIYWKDFFNEQSR